LNHKITLYKKTGIGGNRARLSLTILSLGVVLTAQEWQSDTLYLAPGDSVRQLSQRYILPESIVSNVTDSMIVNSLTGRIYLPKMRVESDTMIVRYRYLPLNLPINTIINAPPRIYTNESKSETQNGVPVPQRAVQYSTDNPDFLKSGTLYRGVTLGSQSGLSLQSGLNLELQGKIAEDITVIGTITDQNIPIEPEGNTQTLDEIDKVFIRVGLPHEQITFGDFEVNMHSGSLGNYSRKLQGIDIVSNRHNMRNTLGGAVTKGQYYSNYFLGEEGNQGPYQLTGKDGVQDIIVLAGTEKIWLNGQLLTRGESNDYTIDYSTAEITFMPRQIITAESRISVDFQYSDLIYQKNIYLAGNSTSLLDNKLKIAATAISESDDKENPIEITLSTADKKLLKALGDDASVAYQSTITEDSAGAYILVNSIMVYVGSGLGTHTATFYNVGEDGRYKKNYSGDITYFAYVDKADGATSAEDISEALYLPAKPLKFPTSRQLYHVNAEWQPTQNFTIKAEVAHSKLDKNLFSVLDDDDNGGSAVNLESSLNIPLARIGQITISGRYKQEGRTFDPIDRNQEVEYRRKWDLPSDSTNGERYYEGLVRYALNSHLIISTEGGSYTRAGFNSDRLSTSAVLSYKMLETCQFTQEIISRAQTSSDDVNWTRRGLKLATRIQKIRPFVNLNYEIKNGDTTLSENFRFLEQIYGVGSAGEGRLVWQVQTTLRRDDVLDSTANVAWNKSTQARNISLNGQISDWHSLSVQGSYIHRVKTYYDQSTADVDVDLIDLSLKHEPRKLPFRWESLLKIESQQTVKKEWRYYYVGEGLGDYLYDSTYAEYVPDYQGDYILRILPSSIKEPVTKIEDGLRFQFDGSNLKTPFLKQLFKRISTLTDIRLQQEISDLSSVFGYLITPVSAVDTSWANYYRVVQHDFNLRMPETKSDLRLRYYASDQVTEADVRGLEKTFTNQWSLRYRGRIFGETTIESESAIKNYTRASEINVLRNRDIYTLREDMTLSQLIDRVNLIGTELSFISDRERGSDPLKSLLIGLKLNYERKMAGKGRWKIFTELDKVSVTPQGESIPYEMSNGKNEGWTIGWGASVEYRVGSNVSIRSNYEGWKEPERRVYHIGSAEVRVSF